MLGWISSSIQITAVPPDRAWFQSSGYNFMCSSWVYDRTEQQMPYEFCLNKVPIDITLISWSNYSASVSNSSRKTLNGPKLWSKYQILIGEHWFMKIKRNIYNILFFKSLKCTTDFLTLYLEWWYEPSCTVIFFGWIISSIQITAVFTIFWFNYLF